MDNQFGFLNQDTIRLVGSNNQKRKPIQQVNSENDQSGTNALRKKQRTNEELDQTQANNQVRRNNR